MKKVLFVCLGNICRSPMAQGIFEHLLADRGLSADFEVDSAGTIGYHAGSLPDPNMRKVAKQHGIVLNHRSRRVTPSDFQHYDYILAMDSSNMRDLRNLQRKVAEPHAKLMLMREFDGQRSGEDVADPYGFGENQFEACYQVLLESCGQLLDDILAHKC